MIRLEIPAHLRTLAKVEGQIELDIEQPVTLAAILNALEARYPMLKGTIRNHNSQKRCPYLRFFACEQDVSNIPANEPLPDAVATGQEPLLIVGAIAGG